MDVFKRLRVDKKFFLKESVISVLLLTISFLVIYFVNQQSLRQSANDPQLQISNDAASELSSGKSLEIFLEDKLVDIDRSLASYVYVYGLDNKLRFSTARLGGNVPPVPSEVLEKSKSDGLHMTTWEPKEGVKQALVAKYYAEYGGGFVVSGRSLMETEARTNLIKNQMMTMWAVSIVVLLFVIFTENRRKKNKNK